MYELLEMIGLIKIGDYIYEGSLSGGRASATLIYKNNDESFIMKLLIAPRNEYELKRFEQESDALLMIVDQLHKFEVSVSVPKLVIPFTQHLNLPVYYFLMEKVDGDRLDVIINRKPLPWDWKESLIMLFRISSSLKFIELKFIHRDLHPLNIIVRDNYEYSKNRLMMINPGITILDFGCTKDSLKYEFGYWEDDAFRVPGAISSWSPELLINPNEVDYKHDSWALGVLFYRFLTNKFPYPSDCIGDVLNYEKNLQVTIEEIENKQFPLAIKLLVKRCLEIDKDKRFSVSQIVDVCNDILHSDLMQLGDERIEKYFSNGASLYVCDHCHEVDISGRNSLCNKCGHTLEYWDTMTPVLHYF